MVESEGEEVMRVNNTEASVKKKQNKKNEVQVDNFDLVIRGNIFKTAKVKEEWDEDIEKPASLISKLSSNGMGIDMFSFTQRPPEFKPKYDYWMEWDNVAAIPISNYEYWLQNQLSSNHRNKLRKASREGVVIKRVDFNDELVSAIQDILNEVPLRQGIPFSDYGKDYATVKREHETYLDRSDFIGAYFQEKLIGYLKIVSARKYIRTMQIVSMEAYRDKGPTNALIAEAVKICIERKAPFLVYGKYSYGKGGSQTLQEFKHNNGFEHILIPRYYVPLTMLGRVILKWGLHHGILGVAPRKIIRLLLTARRKWYAISSAVK